MDQDFAKQIVTSFIGFYEKIQHDVVIGIWQFVVFILKEHWLSISIFLLVIFIISLVIALTTRRWGMFGSVCYHYLYFGILFLIGLIFSPEIFTKLWFDIVLVILYVVCFKMTGIFLEKLGLRRSRY